MKWLSKFIATVFLICAGTLFYTWHHEQLANKQLLDTIKVELEKDRSIKADSIGSGETASNQNHLARNGWSHLHDAIRNTVVQVFVHVAEFNWLEPYKTPKQIGGSGTGFFIDESGLLITNAHVVDQYRAVYIQIPHFGKRRFDVEVIGVSPERDLALLQVDPDDLKIIINDLGKLPILKLGNSDDVHRADEIMTLGFPLGQQFLKSTVGVVSGRQHIGGRSLIQIDAAINPGNSGGPALNKDGQVVGVNTSGIVEGGTQNVGYIIPSSEVDLFLKQLQDTPVQNGVKFLRKPFLGVLYNNATDTVARYLKNPLPGGLYLVEVYKGSPLDKAGVQVGDMLYEIDGHKIDYFGEIKTRWSEDRVSIIDYIARLMPGDKIHMVIYRNGLRKELMAELDFTEAAPIRARYPGYEAIDYEIVGGMVVMELALNHLPLLIQNNSQLAQYVDLNNQTEPALVITHILPDSVASRTRALRSALVLKEVNEKSVRTLHEFRDQLGESLKSGFLAIKTQGNVFAVLPFDQVLKDEPKIAGTYFYTISPFIQGLINQAAPVNPA